MEGVVFPLRTRREYVAGDKVKVLLRPEDLKVYHTYEQDQTEGPRIWGRIDESVYKGATVDIAITLESGKKIQAAEFFNEDDVDINYNAGERVTVGWVEGWEVVLNDESE